jgi:hypothetical protein
MNDGGTMNKIDFRIKKILLVFIAVTVFIMSNKTVLATENGGCAYPNGAEDFMAGAVPPPGTYFLNYFLYYPASDFKDSNGHNVFSDFDLKVTANVFRFVHVTDKKIFGGFLGMQVLIPVLNIDIEIMNDSDNKTGIGDIVINPFLLSWHFKNWHFATGLDFFMPTGNYDKEDLANTSRNYWTFEPAFGVTYVSDSGFEISSKFMYDFNTKNDDTDYKSGQEFHCDYTIGKKFENVSVGIGGYYYKQVTSDEIDGEKVSDGLKGQVFAFGPQLKYDYKNMSFTIKYQKETEVENRAEGQNFWFKFVYAF